jgi:hypothetical protein
VRGEVYIRRDDFEAKADAIALEFLRTNHRVLAGAVSELGGAERHRDQLAPARVVEVDDSHADLAVAGE